MKAYAAPFEKYVNLADARLGTRAISVTDDWFADVNRMFQPGPAVWKEGVFDDNGKWMDGWESRRKRFEGYDHAVIRLGVPGWIKGVDIDTSHFTGNFPPSASLEACFVAEGDPNEDTVWSEVLPAVELKGNSHHYHEIAFDKPVSHLRFNIYPDGGVARLRVHGIPYRDWSSIGDNEQGGLAAVECGCQVGAGRGYVVMGAELRNRRRRGQDTLEQHEQGGLFLPALFHALGELLIRFVVMLVWRTIEGAGAEPLTGLFVTSAPPSNFLD